MTPATDNEHPVVAAQLGDQLLLTHVMYGLHAVSALAGLTGAAFVVTVFLTGWPSIIAVILNYLKRAEVRGTWLYSHFRWQLRTFWFALLWLQVAWLLAITFIGIPAALLIMLATGLWIVYRLLRGWLSLNEGKAMPVPAN